LSETGYPAVDTSIFANLKRLLKHSAIYGIGHIVTRSLGFLLLPLYTNYIPAGEFGKAALIFTFLGIMNVIYLYGMDVAFLRHFLLYEDDQKRKALFNSAFLSIVTSASLFSAILLFKAKLFAQLIFGLPHLENLLIFSALILWFDAVGNLPFMYLRAREKSLIFIGLKFTVVLVNVVANILFIVKLKYGVSGIFAANAVSSAFALLILSPVIVRNFRPQVRKTTLFELLRFGLPYVPSGLAAVIMDLVDRFILQRLTDYTTTGIYSAGYKLGMFMALFVAAFRFAWHPFFLSVAKQENAKQIYSKVLNYFVFACSMVFLLISFFIDEIVRLRIFGFTLFGVSYWSSTRIVPVIMLSYLMYGIYVNFLIGIYLKKKTHVLPFITGTAAVINVLFNFLLIPQMGMMGAAWATLIAYFSMAAILYFVVQRWYYISYEWRKLTLLVFLSAAAFFLQRHLSFLLAPVPRLLLVLMLPVGLWIFGFFEPSAKRRILNYLAFWKR